MEPRKPFEKNYPKACSENADTIERILGHSRPLSTGDKLELMAAFCEFLANAKNMADRDTGDVQFIAGRFWGVEEYRRKLDFRREDGRKICRYSFKKSPRLTYFFNHRDSIVILGRNFILKCITPRSCLEDVMFPCQWNLENYKDICKSLPNVQRVTLPCLLKNFAEKHGVSGLAESMRKSTTNAAATNAATDAGSFAGVSGAQAPSGSCGSVGVDASNTLTGRLSADIDRCIFAYVQTLANCWGEGYSAAILTDILHALRGFKAGVAETDSLGETSIKETVLLVPENGPYPHITEFACSTSLYLYHNFYLFEGQWVVVKLSVPTRETTPRARAILDIHWPS
eukprot:gb/GECG01006009.1/.p1 GENE.gb/GECG01006009.1/~~gb/GECG01006009.1/.p1  ORF type:complete len:342 (+),score=29.18 gb/GECG01006009.1/:1-1026(+)